MQVQGFFFVFFTVEDAYVDEVVEGEWGFVAATIGFEFAGPDREGDFVFVVGGGSYGGGDGFVVVEDDVFEGVGDVVLEVCGGLGAEGVDELAGVGVGAGLVVGGVGVCDVPRRK